MSTRLNVDSLVGVTNGVTKCGPVHRSKTRVILGYGIPTFAGGISFFLRKQG